MGAALGGGDDDADGDSSSVHMSVSEVFLGGANCDVPDAIGFVRDEDSHRNHRHANAGRLIDRKENNLEDLCDFDLKENKNGSDANAKRADENLTLDFFFESIQRDIDAV